jgi:L-asparagine transporter-like permease
MKLERSATGLFFKIFLGMYIAFLIAVISFIIRPDNIEPRFGLPVGGLFAAVGNKYIIDSLLPETTSFTLVDSLHSITFLFIFFTISISAISLIFINKGKPEQARNFDKMGALVITITYAVINILLVSLAIIG